MRMLTEDEFNEWKLHPMTQELLRILEAKRDLLRRQWEGGSYEDWTQDGTALVNMGNIGLCRGYSFVQDLDYETYVSEIEDAK